MAHVSWVFVGLLACAVTILVAAEWPRLARRISFDGRRKRERERRKRQLRVLTNDSDDFAASVQRDLAQLPTIEERDSSNGR